MIYGKKAEGTITVKVGVPAKKRKKPVTRNMAIEMMWREAVARYGKA